MWQLVIEQTTKKKWADGSGEYDHTESIVYKSDNVRELLLVIPTLASADAVGKTTYIIEKVVEE